MLPLQYTQESFIINNHICNAILLGYNGIKMFPAV